jgi:APA family basic amino acid/polyamine antiporter
MLTPMHGQSHRRSSAFGHWTLVALVVANMIGAGVFTTSGFALADLGSPWRVLAAWLIGGLLALCGALSYGALARIVPESGGEYLYLSRAVHPIAGFVAGWISLLAGFTGAIAYSALAFAAYAAPADGSAAGASWIATLVIVAAAALHALRVRPGAWVQNAAVALKLACVAAFFAFALAGDGPSSWAGLSERRGGAYEIPSFSLVTFALSLMWISFSYSGFNAAVYLAGEVPSGRTRVPRAVLMGTFLTMVVYLMLNGILVLVPSYAAVASKEQVAAIAAQALGGDALAAAVRGIVALALFTSVSSMLMIGPRVYAKMADEGLAPRGLRLAGETPTAAVLLQALLAVVVVWITGLQQLLSYLGFTLGLSAAATVASLFLLVRRSPDRTRGLPGYPWAPAVFVVCTLLFAALAATRNPWEMVAALATIASGVVLYTVMARPNR